MSTILSRRRLGLGALGATLVGTRATAEEDGGEAREIAAARQRQLPWTFAPVPIAGGFTDPLLSPMGAFHTFGGPGTEPSSIGNFKGSSGIGFISGNVTRTNVKTGQQEYLPFNSANMRFMTGTFKGTDEEEHPGTFAFV